MVVDEVACVLKTVLDNSPLATQELKKASAHSSILRDAHADLGVKLTQIPWGKPNRRRELSTVFLYEVVRKKRCDQADLALGAKDASGMASGHVIKPSLDTRGVVSINQCRFKNFAP